MSNRRSRDRPPAGPNITGFTRIEWDKQRFAPFLGRRSTCCKQAGSNTFAAESKSCGNPSNWARRLDSRPNICGAAWHCLTVESGGALFQACASTSKTLLRCANAFTRDNLLAHMFLFSALLLFSRSLKTRTLQASFAPLRLTTIVGFPGAVLSTQSRYRVSKTSPNLGGPPLSRAPEQRP